MPPPLTPTMESARQRSRKGCLTCRKKRKKCDEAKPSCTRCTRGDDHCIWPSLRSITEPSASGPYCLPWIQPRPHKTSQPKFLSFSSHPNEAESINDLGNCTSSQHTCTIDLNLDSRDAFPNDILGSSLDAFGPDSYFGFSFGQLCTTLELLPEPSPPQNVFEQPWRSSFELTPLLQRPILNDSAYVDKSGTLSPGYALDEDEEETFKTAEWLPATKYVVHKLIYCNDQINPNALDSYLVFLVRYCYDSTRISEIASTLIARFNMESVRLAIQSTATLFQSYFDCSIPPAPLRKRAKELIDAASAALQVEMLWPETSLMAKLAGISEILAYYYYSGNLEGYMKSIEQATPIVKTLIGTKPLNFHKLHGLDTLDVQIFAYCDVFSSIALSRPTRLVYDCNVEELLRRNQEGPDRSNVNTGLEWMAGLSDALMMLMIQVINLQHSQMLLTDRIAQATQIETALRNWKVWPSQIPNSVMKVQRMSAQEIWRHFVILYLYQVIYKASSSNKMVQHSVKQIVKLASTLRPGRNPDCLLYIPYFITGTFAASVQHRHFLRSRLLNCDLIEYGRTLVNALDELWSQSEATNNYVDWTTKYPPIIVMF